VQKGRAVIAVKRIAADLGLKAGDLLLLDTLCAFSQPQDWEAGSRAIVWPSNGFLMDQTGFSLSSVKRHARRLLKAGIIAFHDSPNGKRWGRRGQDGMIIEAYGFDVSPMATRCAGFEARAVEIAQERALCKTLKRHITVTRRQIRARLEADPCEQHPMLGDFEGLLERLSERPKGSVALRSLASSFDHLLQQLDTMGDLPQPPNPKEEKADPKRANNDPHIQTTNQHQMMEKEPNQNQGETRKGLEIRQIIQACPEFLTWVRSLGCQLRNWHDLTDAITQLCPMIGLSPQIWEQAQRQLGFQSAAAAFALVFDKHCTGQITTPNGYLGGMIRKAQKGELHLERSFYGRLSGAGG
jgi:replication initiation protein RepC